VAVERVAGCGRTLTDQLEVRAGKGDRLERWPELFTSECSYRILSRSDRLRFRQKHCIYDGDLVIDSIVFPL
jgi:hypothetical protein